MVGGKVVGVQWMHNGTTRIIVEGTGHDRNKEVVRYVKGHHLVKPEDLVWWQSRKLMWTPKGNVSSEGQGKSWDIVLEYA